MFVDPDKSAPEGFQDPDKPVKASGKQSSLEEFNDMSFPRRAISGAVGVPEAALSMATSLPAMAAGGARGIAGMFLGDSVDEAAAKSAETTHKYTYEPRSAGGRVYNEALGHGFEKLAETAGDIEAAKARLLGLDEAAHRTGGEAGFNAVMSAGPVAAMRPKRAPKVVEAATEAPKPSFEFVDPDKPASSSRNRPESEMFHQKALEPGEFISEDGRRLVQEPYDPGVSAKLSEQERFGTREPFVDESKPLEYNEWDAYRPNDRLAADGQYKYMGRDQEAGIIKSFKNKELEATLMDETNQDRVRSGLAAIRDTSEVPFYRELASQLLKDESYRPDFKIQKPTEMQNIAAWAEFDPTKYSINVRPSWANNEYVFLHENIHAKSHSIIQRVLDDTRVVKEMEKKYPDFGKIHSGKGSTYGDHFARFEPAVKRLKSLFESLENQQIREAGLLVRNPLLDRYGMSNIHEFIAEGFTNPVFQAELARMPLPKELKSSTFRHYWDAFVDSLAKLLGVSKDKHTYLSELLKAGADIIGNSDPMNRRNYAQMNREKWQTLGAQGKPLELEPIKQVQKEIEKKGVMGAAIDQVRDFQLDRRPIDELIAKDLDRPLTDFTPNGPDRTLLNRAYDKLGALVKENLLQDTTIALMMKKNDGTGPLIKWTVDQISRIDREYMAKTKHAVDTTLKPFRQMFHSKEMRPQLREMWDKWQENIGVRDLSRADFKSEKAWKVYEGFQKTQESILKDINAKRVEKGLKPIERIPSYFHSMWEGDYRVFGYDSAGNKKWAYGYKTEMGAVKDLRKLEKTHPDMKWEQSEVVRDKYGLIDLSAFEDALRVMAADDPVTKAIQTTYRDILQHRGFGRTGLHKSGVLGFMGQEGGKQGLRNMERAFDQYVHQAYRYLGNLDKQTVLSDLQKIPLEKREQVPQTMDFLYSYIHKARGARNEVWYDKLAGELTNAVGLGRSLPGNAIHQLSQVATLYWLTSPRFIFSQTVQSLNALPKLIQEHGTFSGASVWFEGWKNTVSPDAIAKEAVKWASERQYLDPTIKNLIGKDMRNETPTGSRFEAIKELAAYPAAWIEHNAVRAPVFLMFEKALRDSVKNKEQRFEIAAEKADYYMVNYGRVHAPAIYDKMGLVGEAARPLKQYSHNYIGQFIEYASGAKNKAEYAPLAAFFATQVAVGGLKGAMLVAEATIAVNLINAIFGTEVPTPEQLLLKSNLHDLLVFGGLSTALNVDISSSVAAPGLPSMLNIPPIEFTVGMVRDIGGFALKFLKGEETDYDRLRAWMAITPTAAHEFLKQVYTAPGQPIANPNDPQLRGNYRRTEGEELWSAATGAKPIDESRADALIRNVKKELMRDLDKRTNAIDAIVDRLQTGGTPDAKLFQRFVENGGDPRRLSETVVERIKQRQMTGQERHMTGSMTPAQTNKIQILMDYLKQNEPVQDPDKPLGFDPATGEIRPISDNATERDKYKGKIKFPRGRPDLVGEKMMIPAEKLFGEGEGFNGKNEGLHDFMRNKGKSMIDVEDWQNDKLRKPIRT